MSRLALSVGLFFLLLTALPAQAKYVWKQVDRQGHLSDSPKYFWESWTAGPGGYKYTNKLPDGRVLSFEYWYIESDPQADRLMINCGGLYGYVDPTGKLAIEPTFINAHGFYHGLAVVKRSAKDPWELIDREGKTRYTLPPNIVPWVHVGFPGLSKEGLLFVQRGDKEKEGGLFDVNQRKFLRVGGDSTIIEGFSDGLAPFSDGSIHGYVDAEGRILRLPKSFDYAGQFCNGRALASQNGDAVFIDKTGEVVIRLPKNYCCPGYFSDGLAPVAVGGDLKVQPGTRVVRPGAKWGFINPQGRLVIPARFSIEASADGTVGSFASFSEGLASVATGDDYLWQYGYIDKSGAWVIKPQFKLARNFRNGKADVCIAPIGFSKEDWLETNNVGLVNRRDKFATFLKQNDIFSLSREQVQDLLGKPSGNDTDTDFYVLANNECGQSDMGVSIFYQNGTVTKYRFVNFAGKTDPWICAPVSKTGD